MNNGMLIIKAKIQIRNKQLFTMKRLVEFFPLLAMKSQRSNAMAVMLNAVTITFDVCKPGPSLHKSLPKFHFTSTVRYNVKGAHIEHTKISLFKLK